MTLHECPSCRCGSWSDEPIPQPSTSSEWARREALRAAEEAVRRAKDKRLAEAKEGK